MTRRKTSHVSENPKLTAPLSQKPKPTGYDSYCNPLVTVGSGGAGGGGHE